MRKLFCLLGDPVAHSRSPALHARAFELLEVDAVYAPCHVTAADLPAAVRGLRALSVAGFNVTVPHKGEVARLVDRVAPGAEPIGAVNCVARDGEELVGHNTDAPGLLRALRAAGIDPQGARVAVVGAGGSARAAALALADGATTLAVLNRSEQKARTLAQICRAAGCSTSWAALGSEAAHHALSGASLIVHCTTVGMGSDELPFEAGVISRDAALVELVYAGGPGRPLGETALLRAARARGVRIVDGVDVLVHQGIASLEIWLARPQLDWLAPKLRLAVLGATAR